MRNIEGCLYNQDVHIIYDYDNKAMCRFGKYRIVFTMRSFYNTKLINNIISTYLYTNECQVCQQVQSQPQNHNNSIIYKSKPIYGTTICSQFSTSNNNNKGSRNDDDDNNQGKKQKKARIKDPKIIQVTKPQLQKMKKFLQNLKSAIPMPDIQPPTFKSKKNQNAPGNADNSQQYSSVQQNQPDQEHPLQFFSTPEQKLSFRLLKLSQPKQFISIFEQFKNDQNMSVKLIVLYRFWAIGGIDDADSISKRLVREYIADIVSNINKLEQGELQQFLELYISLDRNRQQNSEQLPKMLTQNIKNLLIADPSQVSSRLVVLLLKFWEIQAQSSRKSGKITNNLSKKVKQGYAAILNHYKLLQQQNVQVRKESNKDTELFQPTYKLKDLALISIYSLICGIPNYNALSILTKQLSKTKLDSTSRGVRQRIKRQAIQSIQLIVQSIGQLKLEDMSAQIRESVHSLNKSIAQCIASIIKIEKNLSNADGSSKYEYVQDIQQQDDKEYESGVDRIQASSGGISAVLYTSLSIIQQNMNSPAISTDLSVSFALSVVHTIFQEYQLLGATTNGKSMVGSIDMKQYMEYWQCCSIMYKLTLNNQSKHINKIKYAIFNAQETDSTKNNTNFINNNGTQQSAPALISRQHMFRLVNSFINKLNLTSKQATQLITNQNNDSVIQEYAMKLQRMLFQCLVAYRVLLPANILNTNPNSQAPGHSFETLENVFNQIRTNAKNKVEFHKQGKQQQNSERRVLRELLKMSRKVYEQLAKTNLIQNGQQQQIHNLLIICMIAQSYPTHNSNSLNPSGSELKNINQTHLKYILNGPIVKVIRQLGVSHAKYGTYSNKLLNKYNFNS